MKKMQIYIFVLVVLIAPLYSALLTDDLRVIIPTGAPELHENYDVIRQAWKGLPGTSLRVINTSRGVYLIREQSKPWMTFSTKIVKCGSSNAEQLVLNYLHLYQQKNDNINLNVILE